MAQPLTDAIEALTTYANTVTGASDTTLSDAVATLASGYGGGGAEYSLCLKNFKVPSSKWVANQAIPNLIKTGGCLHIMMTIPNTPVVTTDNEVISLGADPLSSWSPSTNCSMFGFMYNNYNGITNYNNFALRLRGSSLNSTLYLTPFEDADRNIDVKFYADRVVNVLTGTTTYYSSDSTYTAINTAMTNLCTHDYISVGCNQGNTRWDGNIVTLYAIEGE